MTTLSLKKQQEVEEVFSFYDFNHDGKIYVTNLGVVLRCLGVSMSDRKIEDLQRKFKRAGKAVIGIEELMKLAEEFLKVTVREHQLVRDFETFINYSSDADGGSSARAQEKKDGLMRVQVLKTVMSGIGEKLSDREMNNMIKDCAECTNADGLIDYHKFCHHLTQIG
jgi:Ca2+-binding EF-hand superfamily protein